MVGDESAILSSAEFKKAGVHVPILIEAPTQIKAAGNAPKVIREYVGRVNTKSAALSIAHMISPEGWTEPAQIPEFEEYTIVLKGVLRVLHDAGLFDVRAGQAVLARRGERVQYSSPEPGGAEYIAVCLPAFSPETVHRE